MQHHGAPQVVTWSQGKNCILQFVHSDARVASRSLLCARAIKLRVDGYPITDKLNIGSYNNTRRILPAPVAKVVKLKIVHPAL